MSYAAIPSLAVLLSASLMLSACASAPPLVYVPTGTPNPAYSTSVQAGQTVYIAGQLGRTAAGPAPDFVQQASKAMENVAAAFSRAGVPMDNVIRCQVYLTDISRLPEFSKIYVAFFKPERLPARTSIGVADLPFGAEVEVDCIGQRPSP